ncbi:TetR family transcriptional regulator [Paenibacillus sp. 481]|nr:TetR family transcriptional regulator [Paenibacillus sp. 481]
MEDICTITQRSKGSIYYHFKSKEELFLFLCQINIEEWVKKWREMEHKYTNTMERLYAVAEHFIDNFETTLMYATQEFVTSQIVSLTTVEKMVEISRIPNKVYEEIVQKGIDEGELKQDNVQDLMYIVYAMLSGLGTLYYDYEMDMKELKRMYKKGIDVLWHGISVNHTTA